MFIYHRLTHGLCQSAMNPFAAIFALLGQLPPEMPLDPLPEEVEGGWTPTLVLVAVFGAALILILIGFVIRHGKLWLRAYMSSADVGFWSLVGMGFRQVDAAMVVDAKVMAAQAALDIEEDGITTPRLEAHCLAGGNVPRVMRAIIAAQRAEIDLDFDRAAAIDLAGRDVEDAVRTARLAREGPDKPKA